MAELYAAGTPEGYVTWRLAMLNGIKHGEDAYLSDGVERVLQRPSTDFRQWALREVPGAAWASAHVGTSTSAAFTGATGPNSAPARDHGCRDREPDVRTLSGLTTNTAST
ncbi:hypothetical protein OJ963_40810 [Streptomyces sp. RS2]|uniref:hypothetical protein n=1 Tax=Streptomyces sp. RS2 TaxID=1451205 RepID=UPI0021F85334|nr:hypothetical protein [Streptomyces sp. RS2]MCW1100130.1 hypothetical protein [Streptomyces sp. RS2]